jgi:hypothetical protein
MKSLIVCIMIMLSSIMGYSQNELDKLMTERVPNCEDIDFNSKKLIIKYYSDQKFDSAKLILNYWETNCGISEPIMRTKILFAIQENNFTEAIYDSTILFYLMNYQDRIKRAEPTYYRFVYNGESVSRTLEYNKFTQKVADELVGKQPVNSIELLFCRFYANVIENPFEELQKEAIYDHTKLKSFYNKEIKKFSKRAYIHAGIITGIWVPTGNASLLGIHPVFGIQGGIRYKKMTFDVTLVCRFLKSQNDYIIFKDGMIDTTDHYSGWYAGLDVERELFKFKRNHFDILAGIGYDGFSTIDVNKNDNITTNDYGYSIGSLNINGGLGYKHSFDNDYYVSVQAKYNFVGYKNSNGTDFTGNCITISVILGGILNNYRDYQKRLRCQE